MTLPRICRKQQSNYYTHFIAKETESQLRVLPKDAEWKSRNAETLAVSVTLVSQILVPYNLLSFSFCCCCLFFDFCFFIPGIWEKLVWGKYFHIRYICNFFWQASQSSLPPIATQSRALLCRRSFKYSCQRISEFQSFKEHQR